MNFPISFKNSYFFDAAQKGATVMTFDTRKCLVLVVWFPSSFSAKIELDAVHTFRKFVVLNRCYTLDAFASSEFYLDATTQTD